MTSTADKESSTKVETITIDDQESESKENRKTETVTEKTQSEIQATGSEDTEAGSTFFSPPKKKFKQDAIPFTKLPKNEETQSKEECKDAAMEVDADVVVISDPDKTIESTKSVKSKTKGNDSPKVLSTEKNASKPSPASKESIPFPKLSKEEALKETEKEIQITPVKVDSTEEKMSGEGGTCDTPVAKKTPNSNKKASPLSKEERQKLKEEKEAAKIARAKEIEEKRKKKEEEKLLKQAEKEKREAERKEKERQKEEEKKLKEEERKKKEEKKEEERKAKEEEKKAKEEERLKKEEQARLEKEKKDAEREKKEQERKLKEEQKKQEEEKKRLEDEAAKKKKEKAANQFRSFFTKKKGSSENKAPVEEVERQRFEALPVKPDSLQAPIVRNTNIDRELIDKVLAEEIQDIDTYLIEISKKLTTDNKKLQYISRRKKRREQEELRKSELNKNKQDSLTSERTKPRTVSASIPENVVVIEDNSVDGDDDDEDHDENDDTTICDEKYLYVAKLLQFSENTRPPYYGTWRKKTKYISGRRPFQRDTDIFNYDVDSDEEWIDEPGENLSDAADEDEEEEKETEDDQDGFFVPHGYLSDDEGVKDEEDEEDEEGDGDATKTMTSAKTNDDDKMKLKVCTFERKFQRIKHHKPICIGISFTQKLHEVNPMLKDYMKIVLFKPQTADEKEHNDDEDMEVGSPDGAKSKGDVHPSNVAQRVPEEAMPLLIKFVHGNVSSLTTMIGKFREYWNPYAEKSSEESRNPISKRQLEKKIQSIASRTGNREGGKTCYIVRDEIITKYGLPSDLKYGETLPELKIDSIVNSSAGTQPNENELKDSKPAPIVNDSANPQPVAMEIS